MKARIKIEWKREDDGWLYEYRSKVLAVVECPKCGRQVDCEGETESWIEKVPGRWLHQDYGPAQGECCGLLLVDSWDGARAYVLDAALSGGAE